MIGVTATKFFCCGRSIIAFVEGHSDSCTGRRSAEAEQGGDETGSVFSDPPEIVIKASNSYGMTSSGEKHIVVR
jgi:hypothetical protein